MSEQKPFLSILSFLGFQVNAAIEERHGNKISFSDIYKGLEERNLFELLNEKLPGILDISLFLGSNEEAYLEQCNGVLNALSDAASGMKGRERKKKKVWCREFRAIFTDGLHFRSDTARILGNF